ncbi:expressed unknown protein [Seminavis robusta]|uniref:Uncharacterized protein n=1 Tax=Seminavis robusta TaxID=568900 RepID=A0A9N8F383_9STRA|nr:expressed unknown protein [Seminavis robusta]|eukprot:Sro2573_g331670.1 n/a (346) ;mRNA; f:2284-3321
MVKETTGLSRWKEQLFTKDDPLHLHKTLGFACLLSYAFRFARAGAEQDMGFATHPEWTIPTILLHLSLNLSSLEFKIPTQRITTDGGRIWPQYRLHSLVFLSRSLACLVANHWRRQQTDSDKSILHLWIVLGTMAAGDWASNSVGKHRSNSIRDLKGPVLVKYYFSLTQFLATAMTLVLGWKPRSSVHFYFCFVIQLTAFLMTLRRKHLVSHGINIVLYALLLGVGIAVAMNECRILYPDSLLTFLEIVALVGFTAALWRMGPWPNIVRPIINNKYMIWTAVYFFSGNYLRPVLDAADGDAEAFFLTKSQVKGLAWGEVGVVILFGVYKYFGSEIQISATLSTKD